MAAARTQKKPVRKKAAPRKAAPPPRARRSLPAGRPHLAIALEPHQLDIVALALIAIGIFLAGVDYFHWAGGTLGNGTVKSTKFLLGEIGYAIPVGLIAAGGLVLARELRPPDRPLRTGSVCLVIALTLALEAGTLGLGPGRVAAGQIWHAGTLEARGGILGAAEYWVSSHLFSTAGADILAVFLLVAAVILLSGATLASAIRVAGAQVAQTGQAIRRTGETAAPSAGRRSPAREPDELDDDENRFEIPEPETAELVIRATHVEAPPIFADEDEDDVADEDGHLRAPTLHDPFADEDEDDDIPDATLPLTPEPVAEEPLFEDEPEPLDEVPEEPVGGDPYGPPEPVDADKLTPQGRYRASVIDDPDFVWRVPPARKLTRSTGAAARPDTAGQEEVARNLVETLGHFGIDAKVIGRVTGPHITRYELRLAPGTKVSKVANLKDDLAYALAATDVRILAPIPGKTAVGIEVPNANRKIVHLGDVFQEPPEDWSPLTVWLGKDIGGRAIGADLAKMPHLLVAGTTGAGKSACVNSMLCSILLRATPHDCRLVLVDPKQVELNHYESIPHLLTPVITSPRMAANALQNLVKEMEQRYGTMSLARTRNLPELNRYREKRGEPPLPYILCVIDELADLMMVAPADVEDSIIRLAQKARAVGIHLVLATQSPRVDVITGMIKANVPSRIAFAVSSQTDSRVILDQNGAESLLGQGDMLFSPVGTNRVQRIQGAYIDEDQIADITESWRRQGEPEFQDELLQEVTKEEEPASEEVEFHPDEDPLLEEAIFLVAQMGTASTSMLQRRLRLGYTRAGRVIDMLERRGIISGYEGSKPRQVLITEADVPRILSHLAEGASPAQTPPPAPPAPPEPSEDDHEL
jgi:S-DNA-T family DNA segregation ATPase FtsK/SpoIIIE